MIRSQERAMKPTQAVITMKDTISKESQKEWASTSGRMEKSTRESGSMDYATAQGPGEAPKTTATSASGRVADLMASECCSGSMETVMRDTLSQE